MLQCNHLKIETIGRSFRVTRSAPVFEMAFCRSLRCKFHISGVKACAIVPLESCLSVIIYYCHLQNPFAKRIDAYTMHVKLKRSRAA